MTQQALVGTWKLVSYELRYADGTTSHPLGRRASGYLIYIADGHICGAMMRDDRPHFAGDNFQKGGVEDQAATARTYVCYCGPYEVRGEKVVHHVEVSLFPNWVGTTQERDIELVGDRLTLSAPIASRDRQGRVEVRWRRA